MSTGTESPSPHTNAGKVSPDDEAKQIQRALKHNNDKATVLKPYLRAARWISPSIHPYAALTSVIFTGLEEESTEDDDASQRTEIGKDEEITVYRAIMDLHPSFEDVVTACAGHKNTLHNLIQMLESQSRSARNSDVSSLNGVICEFLTVDNDRITYDTEESPMPAKTNLQGRGWNHPLFAVLLSPYCRFIRICDNPEELFELMTDAENAEVDISESEWPTFLYASDTIPDPDDDRHGLFRGNLLPVAYRHTFTSPQSALQPLATVKGRLNKAQLHKLTEVTGRTIAYICVLVRIALRGRGWGTEDGAFDYEAFYQNIVKMFEDDPEDCWVIETLDWWNKQVPGLAKSLKATKKPKKKAIGPDGRILDPVARSAAQRAAKEARAKADAIAAQDAESSNSEPSSTPSAADNSGLSSTPTSTANSEPPSTEASTAPPSQESAKRKTPPEPTAISRSGHSSTANGSTMSSISGSSPLRNSIATVAAKHGVKTIVSDSELSDAPESEGETKQGGKTKKRKNTQAASGTAAKKTRRTSGRNT